MTGRSGGARLAAALAIFLLPLVCQAGTFNYEIVAEIRYDVIDDGVTLPDTTIWGMPDWAGGGPSGTMDLVIDSAGNVSGTGAVRGSRSIGLTNLTFGLTDGAWGTPDANVAPMTAATVHLQDSFLGDITGMNTVVSGFIKDGNSGDFFYLGNGIGPDGKIEFTVSGPSGMSLTVTYKGFSGAGTGTYQLYLDGGELAYDNGTTTASVGIIGVVSHSAWMDPVTQTFFIPDMLNIVHPGSAWYWYYQWPRSINNFTGSIDATGNFVGSAQFNGLDFTSLTGSTTSGTFSDGNSAGFDLSNGLQIGDSFTTVLTDSTGQFDLVINGTLIADPADFDLDGDVDGADFLKWQRGESPNPLSATDLATWEANYGTVAPFSATSTAAPEPATGVMVMLGMAAMLFRRDVVVS